MSETVYAVWFNRYSTTPVCIHETEAKAKRHVWILKNLEHDFGYAKFPSAYYTPEKKA